MVTSRTMANMSSNTVLTFTASCAVNIEPAEAAAGCCVDQRRGDSIRSTTSLTAQEVTDGHHGSARHAEARQKQSEASKRATLDQLKNKPRSTTEFSLYLSDGNGGHQTRSR